MAGKKLARTVIVQAPPGSAQSFAVLGPDDDVPDWAAEQIGDHAYEPETPAGAPINVSEAPGDSDGDSDGDGDDETPETPAASKRTAAKK